MLTNAGGPAALAADELDRWGLTMADLAPETIEQLKTVTPRGAQLGNPVDMLGGPQADMYSAAGRLLLQDPNVDMLMAIFVPQAITPVNEVADHVIAAAEGAAKPVVCCLVGGESITDAVRKLNRSGVPFYQDPNRAGRALGGLWAYRHLRHRPETQPREITDVDHAAARAHLADAWSRSGAGFLDAQLSAQIAAAYGVPVPPSGIAASTEDAVALAGSLGYPVAMKLIAPGIVHKADVGGVRLGLLDASSVRSAFSELIAGYENAQAFIQRMAPRGQEVILGLQADEQFGPVLMFGMGGTLVEALRDVAFRLAPIDTEDARSMLAETAAGRILQGIRGMKAGDIEAVIEVLRRVGQLAFDFPCINGLDINPLIVGEAGHGVWAVDVRVSLGGEPG